MRKRIQTISLAALAGLTILAISGCTATTPATTAGAAATRTRTVQVQKGDLDVTVSVDGNLNMPQAFNLRFGAPGDVKEVLVQEGDRVKAGAILAKLDDTAQRLSVKQSNNGVQSTLSNLYQTVPRLPQFPTTFYDVKTATTTNPDRVSDTTTLYPDTINITTTETVWLPSSGPVPTPGTTIATPTTTTDVTTSTLGATTTTITTTNTYNTTTTVVVTSGPTVVTTTGTETTSLVTTTIANTITTSQSVHTATTVADTVTNTIIEKPRWDWAWDDTNNVWIHNPILPDTASIGLPVGYPAYYPNSMALTAYNWANDEVTAAQSLFLTENYTESASQLYIALSDLECSLKILEDAMLNPASGLGNVQASVPQDTAGYITEMIKSDESFAVYYIQDVRTAMASVKMGRDDIAMLRDLVAKGKKSEAGPLFDAVVSRMQEIGKIVMKNINVIHERSDTDVYGRDISNYLYSAASGKLDAALKGIETGGTVSADLDNNLTIARHYMMLCNAILGTNDYVLQHGLSLKAENQYKVELESKMIDVSNKRDDFLKTVIMTPVDGIVVSVGVKKNDVLSSQDYSSKGTIQVVDTSQIKFIGTVDEIDILKIKKDQKVNVSVDAVSGKTFPGKVSFISPSGTASTGGVVKFTVTVLLDPADVDLKGGLTATADIAISRVENALLLPVTAVTTTSTGSFVNVSTDNTTKTEKKPVTLGAQTQTYVQILSGLKEGDSVVITEKATGGTINTQMGGPGGGGGPPH